MNRSEIKYVRFADDLLFLSKSNDEIIKTLNLATTALKHLKLKINEEKTAIRSLSESFTFLGYRFDEEGKVTSEKGIQSLLESLKIVEARSVTIDDLRFKSDQVLRGWSQYFSVIPWSRITNPHILLHAASYGENKEHLQLIYDTIIKSINIDELDDFHIPSLLKLCSIINNKIDASYWVALTKREREIERYEWIEELLPLSIEARSVFFAFLRSIFSSSDQEKEQSELMDWLLFEEYFQLAQLFQNATPPISPRKGMIEKNNYLDTDIYETFYQLFSGREDRYYLEENVGEKRVLKEVNRPWNLDDIKRHLNEEVTITKPLIRSNKTLEYVVIDIDVIKPIASQYVNNLEGLERFKKMAFSDALLLQRKASEHGFISYIEDSGFRGFHLWFFIHEPLALRDAYEFLAKLIQEGGTPSENITWEIFPKQRRLKEGYYGQAIKLPLSQHVITKKKAVFVDEQRIPLEDQFVFIKGIKRNHAKEIHTYLGIDSNNVSNKQEWSNIITKIVKGCKVVEHFIEKATKTKYLPHEDRLFLLNVFGTIEVEGPEFLHYIFSHTLNYKKETTNKFIRKRYNTPISCVRIRENFPQLTTQLSCNCHFPCQNNSYPSPVRHGIPIKVEKKETKSAPVTTTVINQEKKRATQAAKRLFELRKQQRGVQNSITKVEKELDLLFEKNSVERIEIEIGYLVRHRENDKTTWIIEL